MTNGSRVRAGVVLCTMLGCLIGMTSAIAVPPGHDVAVNPHRSSDLPHDTERRGASSAMQSSAAGDTVFSLCPIGSVQFQPTAGGTDCWGWEAPDGTEYAIMGTYTGIAFVNANTMQVADEIPGPTNGCGSTRWRDIKTYQHYCYAVSECSGTNQGIMIMDMSFLPDSVRLVTSYSTASDFTSHNLVVDTATGFLYAVKRFYNGVRIISLANPVAPVELGFIATADCHDMYARNDTVWIAEGSEGTWSAWNLANKMSPQLIQRVSVPAPGYVHNIWPSGDGRHVVTTEETGFKTVKYWNVEDYNNVQLVGQYLAPSNLAHNAHMVGDTSVISHYESGVAIVDFSNPAAPVELALYDTYQSGEGPSFNGCWGTYPFTTSGKVYASNLNNRLYILEARTVITTDTIFGDTVATYPGGDVRVDVFINNHTPLSGINVPFAWSGPYNLTFDSVSTAGLRTDYFFQKTFTVFDPANKRAAYAVVLGSGQLPLPPGDGAVMSLFFSVPPDAAGASNPIDFSAFASTHPEVMAACLQFPLETSPAIVTLGASPCCIGTSGNVDQDAGEAVDLSDLIYLVNFLFLGGTGPSCLEAANLNGDAGGEIDLSDLIYFVNYLFLGGPGPASCQ